MKKTLLLTLILVLGFSTQAQQFDWVHSSEGNLSDECRSVVRDNDGNLYVFGHSGSGRINVNFLSAGDTVKKNHAFVAKYDSSFNLLWLRSFGGSGSSDEAYAWKALVMPNGNILLGGMFRGKVNFMTTPGIAVSRTSKDAFGDIYLSTVDTSGKLIKNVVFQGDDWDDRYQWKLIVDSNSQAFILANFTNNVDLDPGPGQKVQQTGGWNMFFVCLDSNLDYQWHIRFDNQYCTWWKPIIKPDETILLSGYYYSPMDLHAGPNVHTIHAQNGIGENALMEFSPAGEYLRHFDPFKGITGKLDYGYLNFVDNRYLIPGNMTDSADFNPGEPDGKLKVAGRVSIMMMADSAFNFLAVYNTQKFTVGLSDAIKVGSYYYLPGISSGPSADFDPGQDSFFIEKAAGKLDALLIRLDSGLNFSWAGSTNSIWGDTRGHSWYFHDNTAYFCGEVHDYGHDFDLTKGYHYINGTGIFISKYSLCSPTYYTANDEVLCEGRERRFGDLNITGAGTYTQTFSSNEVCDSVVNLSVSLKPRSYYSFTEEACEGEEFAFAGTFPWNTGSYYDTLQSFNGCDSIIELQFTRKSIDSTVTANAGVLLANATGHNYRWLDCNNQMQPIFGETNREFTPSKNGLYAVEVSANNCADTSHCIEINGVGIAEHSMGMYKVYPNPARDNVFIETKGENLYIILNDITGKPVMTEITGSQTFSLDISDLASGTYYLEIEGPEAKERVKIIKR